MVLSTLPYLEVGAFFYGTIFIGFGILWFVNAPLALSFFELQYPEAISNGRSNDKHSDAKRTMDAMSIIYGIRNIYMGAAIYAAALCGTRTALGWIILAGASVAFVDGGVCHWMVGKGQKNHWGYAPTMAVFGVIILGGFDWVPRGELVLKVGLPVLVIGRVLTLLFNRALS